MVGALLIEILLAGGQLSLSCSVRNFGLTEIGLSLAILAILYTGIMAFLVS
jgi:hypothetical protein